MRHRVLSLATAGLLILSTAVTAFAQVAVTSPFLPAGQTVTTTRVDQIIGFADFVGVPPVASGTFQPQVQATDPIAAGLGADLIPYVRDLDAFFASRFGWRPSRPTFVLLFPNADALSTALSGFRGGAAVLPEELSRPAIFTPVSQGSGTVPSNSYAILVNMDQDVAAQTFNQLAEQFAFLTSPANLIPGATTVISPIGAPVGEASNASRNAMLEIQESLAKQYGEMMVRDLAGTNSPLWFQEGLTDSIAFSIVPGAPEESGQAMAAAQFQAIGNTLPTLSQLGVTFPTLVGGGGLQGAATQGISFLGARSLLNAVPGTQIADLLRGVGAGQPFQTQLQSSTGFNLDQLNTQAQSLIPIP